MSTKTINDYDYILPERLIAQFPPPQRGDSRLLVVNDNNTLADQHFADLLNYLHSGDVLVLNNTKVLPARFFAHKETGGYIEVLVERILNQRTILAHIRASKAPKIGQKILLAGHPQWIMRARQDSLFILETIDQQDALTLLETHGQMPLPPYIQRTNESFDATRYQTVFATQQGAVAAPTAGLHFTDAMLAQIRAKQVNIAYVTLHVGAGTFQPIRQVLLNEHQMHSEWINVPQHTVELINQAKQTGRSIIAVGTTVTRALETAALSGQLHAYQGETDIFITEGFPFRVIDGLVTNFHLPKSTLLILVSAFSGADTIKAAYQHAIAQEYRFFSYGDAMFLRRFSASPYA